MHKLSLFIVTALLTCPLAWAQQPEVGVQGLLEGAAILNVGGQSKFIRVGQSLNGVTLIDANSRRAIVEVDGVHHTLTMSQRISSTYQTPEPRKVVIRRDEKMQYQTTASMNGHSIRVLIDTGANIVAMNQAHARAIGLPPNAGEASYVETASGKVNARIVMLDSVDVGGIKVENVRASVLEGAFPTTILLGMTYLRHVSMSESRGILSLSREY